MKKVVHPDFSERARRTFCTLGAALVLVSGCAGPNNSTRTEPQDIRAEPARPLPREAPFPFPPPILDNNSEGSAAFLSDQTNIRVVFLIMGNHTRTSRSGVEFDIEGAAEEVGRFMSRRFEAEDRTRIFGYMFAIHANQLAYDGIRARRSRLDQTSRVMEALAISQDASIAMESVGYGTAEENAARFLRIFGDGLPPQQQQTILSAARSAGFSEASIAEAAREFGIPVPPGQ